MKMKNAPNIKFLPKDKFTEAIIFAGEDAYSHVQHWIESEGKRAGMMCRLFIWAKGNWQNWND